MSVTFQILRNRRENVEGEEHDVVGGGAVVQCAGGGIQRQGQPTGPRTVELQRQHHREKHARSLFYTCK